MGMIGGILRATGSNGVNVVSKVKNPALQRYIDSQIGAFGGVQASGQSAMNDYISRYLAGAKDSAVRSQQEIGDVDQFYNGDMSRQLAQLRASRSAAINNAADVAGQQAIRGVNQSRLNNDGGPSSYDSRMMISALAPIKAQAAVDNSNQERADLGYVTQNQLSLAGVRDKMANSQAGYGLVPEAVRQSMYASNLGELGSLGQLDQMNKFYGLKQDSNTAADIMDSVDQGIMNAASIYSSVGGGMSKGGEVNGPGTETSDSIPVRLSDGEFVVRASSVKIPGVRRILEVINLLGEEDKPERAAKAKPAGSAQGKKSGGLVRKGVPKYAEGGMVGSGGGMSASGFAPMDAINFWMNSPYGQSFWGQGATATGTNPPAGNQPTQMPQKQAAPKSSGGGGGGGSGLSAQAMALQARVDRDLSPGQFMPSNYGVPALVAPEINFGGNSMWGQ